MPAPSRRNLAHLLLLTVLALSAITTAFAEEDEEEIGPPSTVALAGTVSEAIPITAASSAVIDFDRLAAQERQGPVSFGGKIRTWMPNEQQNPAEPYFPPAPAPGYAPKNPLLNLASPSPSSSFMGLDDVPMADSSYIVIPPDISGGVGPTKIMEAFNNNYRIRDKASGTTLQTLGTATFWASVVAPAERLSLTDPRTVYDPYNDCWIAVMQTVTSGAGKFLVGVSQTSDPQGAWYLYNFNSGNTVDFPIVGFNKNWISVSINRYSFAGTFQRGINLVLDYPQARAGTGTGTLFTHAANSHFCSSPAATYSATAETLYVVTHLSSSGATYVVDTITGTAASPVYTTGGTLVRTGGGWVQPGGNLLPQSAPNGGASACGATPCPLETQDSQVRSAPVYRDGFLYYTQTVGLPSGGLQHTGVQWTKLDAVSGAFVDGGRIEDPTATSSNGGKWYAYPHIAVNAAGDFIVGYSQFSSAQHPSAGYSMHLAGDPAGTIRDPLVYHAGEDYYHKTFSTATGRNRWGDFSTAQVDPSDDMTLWTLQEYGKTRTGTNDGNTGANSSRWSSWWAGVTTAVNYTITASAGANGSITPSGAVMVASGADQMFTITPDSCYHIVDVLVDGVSVGAVPTYTFMNVTMNHTISASFAIDTYTIAAAAGANGMISPNGAVNVNCGNDQMFTIAAAPCYHIVDVAVDGNSIGPVSNYTFMNVTQNHTISASFAIDTYTITASAGAGGSISPSGAVNVNCGDFLMFTITPDTCFMIDDVLVDGVSIGAATDYTFMNVTMNHTISASFLPAPGYTIVASADAGGSISPSGNVPVACGNDQNFTIATDPGFAIADVVVDGGSVGTPSSYLFPNVMANHTIHALFADTEPPSCTVIFPNGGDSVAVGDTVQVAWVVTDNDTVTCVDLLLSRTGAAGPYDTLAVCQPDSAIYDWIVTGPTTNQAVIRIIGHDAAGNVCQDESDTEFYIVLPTSAVFTEAGDLRFSLVAIGANPTHGRPARLSVTVPSPGRVRVAVFDVSGREIEVLTDRGYDAGRFDIEWSGAAHAPAGLYFVRAAGPGGVRVQKVMVTR